MTIHVKLFAILREKIGQSQLSLDLPAGVSVDAAAAAIEQQFPQVKPYLHRCAFAVNQSYVPTSTVLKDNDELAIIPPVSGG